MLKSVQIYTTELNMVLAALYVVDNHGKAIPGIKTLDAPALIQKLMTTNAGQGGRFSLVTEEIELMTSAMIFAGQDLIEPRLIEKYENFMRQLGEYLGHRVY